MIEQLCVIVVGVAGAYLAALGVGALVVPARAARFLLGFASTQSLHFVEILSRVLVGASLIVAAPSLSPAQPFVLLGWLLIGTSTLMLLVPWQWHRRFAISTVPVVSRYIGVVGVASLVGGVLVLVAVFRGPAT
jgi:hypothetical protein